MFDKFVPRVDEDGEPDPRGEPDPNVVYVGPFFDGLLMMGVFKNVPEAVPHTIKPFFYECAYSPEKGYRFLYERCNNIEAAEASSMPWPWQGVATYDRALDLSTLWRDNARYEPGQFGSTPSEVTIADAAPDFWERAPHATFHDIELQEDARFQLHILRKGDRITKQWRPDIGSDLVTQQFVLRHYEEGGTTRVPLSIEDGAQRV